MDYGVFLSTKIDPKKLANGTGIKVVEPEDHSAATVKAIKAKGYIVLAYLSVGTLEKEREWFKRFEKYKLKQLPDWPNEYYVNVRKTNWRCFLVDQAKALKEKGFDGWWLDNLDVYSEYKSAKMYAAIKAVLKQIKAIGGYVMINGGSEWLDDALDKKIKVKEYVDGYTQEEVFSRIIDYDGKGKFGKQKKEDCTYYKSMIERAIKNKIDGFLLEYTKDDKLKEKIKKWCKDNKVNFYISKTVDL